MQIGNEVQMSV